MKNEKLIESVVLLKHKLRQISHYIKDNEIPLSIRIDGFDIKKEVDFENKEYLLHVIADFNNEQLTFYNGIVTSEERRQIDFLKPLVDIENPVLFKLHKEGKLD